MTNRMLSPKRSVFRIKQLLYLILLTICILFWDLLRGFFQGILLIIDLPANPVTNLTELLRLWGSFALLGLLILFSFAIFLFSCAYFLLPNLSLEQQIELWRRLLLYLIGKHGAAVFVRNGKIVAELGEKSKQGVGLLLIDRHSAVLVEELNPNRTNQVKVFAPGIVFLSKGEKIRGSVDLRPQRRSIADLRAYTKDGVEVITHLSTTFTLGQPAEVLLVTYHLDQLQSQPSADAVRVIQLSEPMPSAPGTTSLRRKITSLSNEIDADDREEIHRFVQNFHLERSTPSFNEAGTKSATQYFIDPLRIIAAYSAIPSSHPLQISLDWSDLPLQITIDLFREFIASIPYHSIYSPQGLFNRSLTELKSQFSKRVRNQGVLAYQFVQRKDNLPICVGDEWEPSELIFYPIQSLNSAKFLRSKGIKVLNATFGELKPADEALEKILFDQWLINQQKQSHSVPATQAAPYPHREELTALSLQLANKLHETLASSLRSNQLMTTDFLSILEAEINDPHTRQWLSDKAIHRYHHLRDELLRAHGNSTSSNELS